MNRRFFLGRTAAALFGFSILPPASTYDRVWRPAREPIVMFGPCVSMVFTCIWHEESILNACGLEVERACYGRHFEAWFVVPPGKAIPLPFSKVTVGGFGTNEINGDWICVGNLRHANGTFSSNLRKCPALEHELASAQSVDLPRLPIWQAQPISAT